MRLYEGPYEINKQARPGTFILWNSDSEEKRGMFYSQDLKTYQKKNDNYQDKEDTELDNVG